MLLGTAGATEAADLFRGRLLSPSDQWAPSCETARGHQLHAPLPRPRMRERSEGCADQGLRLRHRGLETWRIFARRPHCSGADLSRGVKYSAPRSGLPGPGSRRPPKATCRGRIPAKPKAAIRRSMLALARRWFPAKNRRVALPESPVSASSADGNALNALTTCAPDASRSTTSLDVVPSSSAGRASGGLSGLVAFDEDAGSPNRAPGEDSRHLLPVNASTTISGQLRRRAHRPARAPCFQRETRKGLRTTPVAISTSMPTRAACRAMALPIAPAR